VVLPYNETAVYDARVSVGNVVTKFDYSLSLLTVVPAMRLRTMLKLGVAIEVPNATVTIDALTSSETGSLAILIDAAETTVSGITLFNAGDENTVYVDVANTTLAPLPLPEPLNSIIFNFDGADGSTSISSSSGTAGSAVAIVYGTAALDTSNKKFGTASLYIDGPQGPTGDWITYDLPQVIGLNDFCVEFWIYLPFSAENATYNYATPYTVNANCCLDVDYSAESYLLYLYDENANQLYEILGDIVFDQWQHIAFYRISGVFYLAVDGVVTLSPATAEIDITTVENVIGDYSTINGDYTLATAWIDEVRVTFNSPVYGAANFSVPGGPF
jgi:hypothetical protein